MGSENLLTVLSVRQPWASLLVTGEDWCENRSWDTKYRGPLWIHAASKVEEEECNQHEIDAELLPTGAIIGCVDLVEIVKLTRDTSQLHKTLKEIERRHGLDMLTGLNFAVGPYGWIVKNGRALKEPVPVAGKLQLWAYEPPSGWTPEFVEPELLIGSRSSAKAPLSSPSPAKLPHLSKVGVRDVLLSPSAAAKKGPVTMSVNLHLNGTFYAAYRQQNPDFDPKTFDCAERTVRKLLETSTIPDHPGMLLGKVQSGKTRTFISIVALAFDNGFDIAIVLSKNSKALIEQTMKRLNSEFSEFVEDNDLSIYDIMRSPEKFTASELESKLIFAAKKQDDNLRRLINLFSKTCPAMKDRRVLIIDDEADNASVGYSKKKDLIEANKIAGQISDLRNVIRQVSFLQVTATPYSLYLQPNEVEVDNKTDFRPTRPAFTELVPVPPEYVGGDTYFGESAHSDAPTLESLIHCQVDHDELEKLKGPDRRSWKIEECLTSPAIKGFRGAFVNFLTGGVILRINGLAAGKKLNKLRYSFLLHSEAGREAHAWQELIAVTLREKLEDAAKAETDAFRALVHESYKDLKQSLVLDGQPVPGEEQVLEGVRDALLKDQITILKVNSDEDVASHLDHTGQLKLTNPFNIFIGGQVIDRGVTLANLIGFYYGRRPQKYQQDTVLQHSRMYGYRRGELGVTRFYTSPLIRNAMFQMEDFDSSLRKAIEAGGDQAVQFIRKAADGSIVPCSPNKILVATTQTIKPFKRILPVGFQTGYATGANGIAETIRELDREVESLCGFHTRQPVLVPIDVAIGLLMKIEPTLHEVEEEDSPPFDWSAARAALVHLSQQHPDPAERGKVWLWAARDRNSARLASSGSHAKFIETPDSEKTEGAMAKVYAIDNPILFLLRQNGPKEVVDSNGDRVPAWRGTPFYWPVIRAQQNTPTAIYAAETVGED